MANKTVVQRTVTFVRREGSLFAVSIGALNDIHISVKEEDKAPSTITFEASEWYDVAQLIQTMIEQTGPIPTTERGGYP